MSVRHKRHRVLCVLKCTQFAFLGSVGYQEARPYEITDETSVRCPPCLSEVLCFTGRHEDNADVEDCMSSRGSSGGMPSSVGLCDVCIGQCCALPGRTHSELCSVVEAECVSSVVRHSLTDLSTDSVV